MAIELSSSAQKALEMSHANIKCLLLDDLKKKVVEALEKDEKRDLDLDEAAQVMSQLSEEIYGRYPNLVCTYQVADGYLWFTTPNSTAWFTVVEHQESKFKVK